MPDPDLKLNSLSRFSKKSPRLVLEEYSHCEVPAGCCGVVLRWRRPDEPIPMLVCSYTGWVDVQWLAIDGTGRANSGTNLVSYGRHTLNMMLRDVPANSAFVMIAANVDSEYMRILRPRGDTTIVSLADGTWRYSLEKQTDDTWKTPDFDDQSWLPLVEKPFRRPRWGNVVDWTRKMTDLGAKGLGIDVDLPPIRRLRASLGINRPLPLVYVRKTFEILPPEGSEAK